MNKTKDRIFNRELNFQWDLLEDLNACFFVSYTDVNAGIAHLKPKMPLLSQKSNYTLDYPEDVMDYTLG